MFIKARLTKLEKIQRIKRVSNSIYTVLAIGNVMKISCGTDTLFSGPIEEGEKIVKELDQPGAYIVRFVRAK